MAVKESGTARDRAYAGPVPARALLVVLGLLVGARAVDRGAQDVAEARARIRRAELGHRAFFLVDLARLDGERRLARRAVERGHLGIDLLADSEAVGALLGAVARQLGLADEAGQPARQRHLDAAFGDLRHGAGDDIALLH